MIDFHMDGDALVKFCEVTADAENKRLRAELQEARRVLFWWHNSLLIQQFAEVNDKTLAFLGVDDADS